MYAIGQTFDGSYPPEAAQWCNENGAVMVPIEVGFKIQAAPAPTTTQKYENLRASRDVRLADMDKFLLADYPISERDLALVKAYRAALRDLPDQPGAPWDGGGDETPWPELPAVG